MCGFVGFINRKETKEAKSVLKQMADCIAHRGPDDESYYLDSDIALGFRRLSIIDLAGGRQPMTNEDDSLVLTFNGEIYNFRELREELEAKGHIFKTQADSETILHGYEEYGNDLPKRLRGMFAFVIWDKREKKLFGARDMFGIKPFYYYNKGDSFLFGSEIKAFLPHPEFEKRLNEKRLPDYLCYEYIPNDETMFENVYKLPSGCAFVYSDGELDVFRYFQVEYNIDEDKTLNDWKEKIIEQFSESVQAHQISDVEVGCFLSSGVDSSYVVREVSKVTEQVKTFSVGYEEEKYSELPYAQEFSKEIGVPNISNKVSADEYFDAASAVQYYMDEPLPNPSEIPLYFLAKNASNYVKVVLSGEGADELFGGYPMYLAGGHFQSYSKIPKPIRKALAFIAGHLPDFKGKQFLLRGALEPYQRFMRANYVFHEKERAKFLKQPPESMTPPEEEVKELFEKAKKQGLDEPTALQFVDIYTWMLYDILLKADRMSMANSLELRVPFLDKKMLELATKIPTRFRAHNEVTKVALREAALSQLPEKTAHRKKLGFPVPLNDWLRQDKFYNRVKKAFESEIASRYFHADELMKILEEHKSGKNGNMKKIWSIYTFLLWYDEFFIKR